jgi:signal transduction histidine kinase
MAPISRRHFIWAAGGTTSGLFLTTPQNAASALPLNSDTISASATPAPQVAAGVENYLDLYAHEIQSPLATLKLALEKLETALVRSPELLQSAPDSAQALHYLQVAQSQCDRELNLVSGLLFLNQLNRADYAARLQRVEIHLNEQAPKIAAAFNPELANRHQVLKLAIAPDLPPLISDPSSIAWILAELLKNASNYSPVSAKIVVAASIRDKFLHLSVQNTGTVTLVDNRIFEPRYQLLGANSWSDDGVGLGLAIAHKLANRLGGSLQVESVEQQTILTLALPISP